MNDNAKKWVEALRSDKFQQTKEKLYDGLAYCCLGVACEVYAKENGGSFEKDFSYDEWFFDGDSCTLPDSVLHWLGIRTNAGSYDTFEDASLLADNDDGCKTFEEIADIIESEPEGLFVK